jgi:hypothetical protein
MSFKYKLNKSYGIWAKTRQLTTPNFKYRYVFTNKYIIEELCLLGYNALQSGKSQPTFRRNMSPSYSGLKSKPRNQNEAGKVCLLPISCWFLACLRLISDDERWTCVSPTRVYWIHKRTIYCTNGNARSTPRNARYLVYARYRAPWDT